MIFSWDFTVASQSTSHQLLFASERLENNRNARFQCFFFFFSFFRRAYGVCGAHKIQIESECFVVDAVVKIYKVVSQTIYYVYNLHVGQKSESNDEN